MSGCWLRLLRLADCKHGSCARPARTLPALYTLAPTSQLVGQHTCSPTWPPQDRMDSLKNAARRPPAASASAMAVRAAAAPSRCCPR